ncbi:MAG: LemA family protein [Acidobacteria bacterium]|nr:LemA family protein [Acidobacteriota bacterium]
MGKIALIILGILLVFVVILAMTGIGQYNGLTTKRTDVDAKWAQVENNLQLRADKIPNLVNIVKGYAKLEEGVLTKIAESQRVIQSSGSTPEQKMDASNQMTGALRAGGLYPFMTFAQAYPNLKSDAQFARLSDELSGTENRLAVARKDYNESTQDYNTSRNRFPAVLIAGMMGFQDKPFFKAEEGSKTAPVVDFSK